MRRSTYQPGGMEGRVGPTNNDISGALGPHSLTLDLLVRLAYTWRLGGVRLQFKSRRAHLYCSRLLEFLGLRAGRVISLYPEIALTHLFGLKG